jgi:hypothetical protein
LSPVVRAPFEPVPIAIPRKIAIENSLPFRGIDY